MSLGFRDAKATFAVRATSLLVVAAVLAVLWWVLSEGDPGAWYVGVPAISLAAWVLARTGAVTLPRVDVLSLIRFLHVFVKGSLTGGCDVALRVLRRDLAIRPGSRRYRWRLPPGRSRVLTVAALSLQPGTLAATDEGETLVVHCLDDSVDVTEAVAQLESLVAAIGGIDLDRRGKGQ